MTRAQTCTGCFRAASGCSSLDCPQVRGPRRILRFTITIDADGNVTNDTETGKSTFSEVYGAFRQIKAEVERQIADRRDCPFNPSSKIIDQLIETGKADL
jgi:hypothetical protein